MSISMKKQAFRIGTAFVFAVATLTSVVAFNSHSASAAGTSIKLINRCAGATYASVSWGTGGFGTTVSKNSSVVRSIAQYHTITVRSDMYRHNGSFYTPYSATYSWVICG
jgi:hypothetical protein